MLKNALKLFRDEEGATAVEYGLIVAAIAGLIIAVVFVLGNKVMVGTVNGNREYFGAALRDLAMAEAEFPNWVARLLTHPVQGLDNYRELIDTLTSGKNVIKAFCEIAPLDISVDADANSRLAYAR